jgi:16S rRNA (adenine1518-N6/adenine1519-N6)-dimethyltransferase
MDARELLRRYGLAAKKSWGQNFLVNDGVYRQIVDATVDGPGDWVVEIGAGLGTLTGRLADRVPDGKVVAVERDPEMIHVLWGELGDRPNVEIAEIDARVFDYAEVARRRGAPIAMCGNLPYQLSSVILFSLLAHRAHITRAVVMLQREVAERLVAEPGGKTYSALTAIVSAYADISTVVRVKPGSFHPPPKVDSAVVDIRPLAAPRAPIHDERHYADVVHGAFAQRRKMVRNSLRSAFDTAAVDAALAAAGIDGNRRGETLSVAELAALAQELPRRA